MAQNTAADSEIVQTKHPVDQMLPWSQLFAYGLQPIYGPRSVKYVPPLFPGPGKSLR
jgi:hypothetical protein